MVGLHARWVERQNTIVEAHAAGFGPAQTPDLKPNDNDSVFFLKQLARGWSAKMWHWLACGLLTSLMELGFRLHLASRHYPSPQGSTWPPDTTPAPKMASCFPCITRATLACATKTSNVSFRAARLLLVAAKAFRWMFTVEGPLPNSARTAF